MTQRAILSPTTLLREMEDDLGYQPSEHERLAIAAAHTRFPAPLQSRPDVILAACLIGRGQTVAASRRRPIEITPGIAAALQSWWVDGLPDAVSIECNVDCGPDGYATTLRWTGAPDPDCVKMHLDMIEHPNGFHVTETGQIGCGPGPETALHIRAGRGSAATWEIFHPADTVSTPGKTRP